MKLIFIFSLPRSGSTLLQRVLNKHPGVATAPETWLLLPLLTSRQDEMAFSFYSSRHCKLAIDEFVNNSVGEHVYDQLVQDFYMSVFRAASAEQEFFLEKTPRNLYCASEIVKVFNEGKFIYLVRNPVAVACSMMSTWGGGRWNIYAYEQDFLIGIDAICKTFNKDKHLMLKYEDLLIDEDAVYKKLAGYLEFDASCFRDSELEPISGVMGDPTGQYHYSRLNSERAESWLNEIDTFTKVYMLRRLLKKIGKAKVELMGYEFELLLNGVQRSGSYSVRGEVSDVLRVVYGWVCKVFQLPLLRTLLKNQNKGILR